LDAAFVNSPRRRLAVAALSLVLAACQTQASEAPPSPDPAATASQESPSELPSLAPSPSPTFPAGRVATRVVISKLGIDLPVMLQTSKYGAFPLCDVALYLPFLGQPGQGRATYLYAHAREGMFLPLLTASRINNGRAMIGDLVEVYTSDNYRFEYKVTEVDRHTRDLVKAYYTTTERLFLQTSEGPTSAYPKLQVVADFVGAEPTTPEAAHPKPHPRICT
jgi:hypothetical protein